MQGSAHKSGAAFQESVFENKPVSKLTVSCLRNSLHVLPTGGIKCKITPSLPLYTHLTVANHCN
jgi:hypothetical protein